MVLASMTLLAGAAASDGAAKPNDTSSLPEHVVTGREERDGVVVLRLRSPYQKGETLLRILAPQTLPPKPRVVFLLPVEAGTQSRFGDGLATAKRLRLHERFGFVLVAPTFSDWPWYADHATDVGCRQESHMMRVVVPLVMELYPHGPAQRGLLGFSKSGWGAWSLLLRHADAFAAAVAWDAPMMMEKPQYAMDRVVGTMQVFETYRIPALLRRHADAVRGRRRLGLLGFGNFRDHHVRCHALLDELGIPHAYADGPKRRHHWDGGWLLDAAETLDALMPAGDVQTE